jgi:hypothetical protein
VIIDNLRSPIDANSPKSSTNPSDIGRDLKRTSRYIWNQSGLLVAVIPELSQYGIINFVLSSGVCVGTILTGTAFTAVEDQYPDLN